MNLKVATTCCIWHHQESDLYKDVYLSTTFIPKSVLCRRIPFTAQDPAQLSELPLSLASSPDPQSLNCARQSVIQCVQSVRQRTHGAQRRKQHSERSL